MSRMSRPPHTVNHTAQVEAAASSSLAASAFLSWPPAVGVWAEGASNKDGNPCNQPTQVVHPGGRLFPSLWGEKRGLYGSRGREF